MSSSSTSDKSEEINLFINSDLLKESNEDCSHCFDSVKKFKVINDTVLPLSIEEFYNICFADNTFLLEFYGRMGYFNCNVTPWEVNSDGCCEERETTYSLELNMTIGPKVSKMECTERLYFQNDRERLIIESVSKCKNVPLGGDFQIEDRWVIEGDGDQVHLTASYHINWLKSSWSSGMLKPTIKTKTEEGKKEFVMDYCNFLLSKSKGIEYSPVKHVEDHAEIKAVRQEEPRILEKFFFIQNEMKYVISIILFFIIFFLLTGYLNSKINLIEQELIDTNMFTKESLKLSDRIKFLEYLIDKIATGSKYSTEKEIYSESSNSAQDKISFWIDELEKLKTALPKSGSWTAQENLEYSRIKSAIQEQIEIESSSNYFWTYLVMLALVSLPTGFFVKKKFLDNN